MTASILLVEDDLAEARRLESSLAHLGYRTTLATDGDAALARLEAERFDAVLLDLVLPGLDGMGLLSVMRMRDMGVPVVVAVTPGGLDAARSALKAGARDFVVKPAGALRLEVAMSHAVAQSHAASQGRRSAPGPLAGQQGEMEQAHPAEMEPRLEPRLATSQTTDPWTSPEAPSNVIRFSGRVEPPVVQTGLARLDARGHVRPLATLEAEAIRFAFSHYGGRMSEVARRLGIGRSTLYRKMADLGLPTGEQTPAPVVAAE